MARILVVEDDTIIQRIMELRLTNEGHEVILASDGLGILREFRISEKERSLSFDARRSIISRALSRAGTLYFLVAMI